MSYCLNPACTHPGNTNTAERCQQCGQILRLQNRYLAFKPLGQGGFGRTFLAVDEALPLKSCCVIKQFFPQQQGTQHLEKASELFRQEAQRLQTLGNHSQIPNLLSYLEQNGYQYLVQEFIDGQTLAQELETEGVFEEAKIRQLLQELLPIVRYIHQHQVIHRDIKPANIIRQAVDKRLFLVDLGAAKYATGTALMMTGTVIGSAEYTAPEQARGKAVFASDIYGLGATCLHLLTGLSPFDLYDSSEGRWIWRDYLQHPVSAALGRMLEKMLEGPTNRRYQTVDEILTDLNQECSSSSSADKHWQPSPKTSASNSQQQLKLTNSESIPNWQPRTASFSVAASGKLATTNQLQNQQQGDLPDKRRKLAKRSMLDFLLLTFIFYILTVMIIGLLSPYPSSFWRGLFEQFQAQWNKPKPPFSIYDQPPKFTPPVERLQTLALPRSVLSLAIKPDGKTIAIGGSDWEYLKLGNLQVWDLKTGKFLNSLSGPSAVSNSHYGTRLLGFSDLPVCK